MIGIYDTDTAQRFVGGEFDAEALDWIDREMEVSGMRGLLLGRDARLHILDGLKTIVADLYYLRPAGDFIDAVLSNDLVDAATRADTVNVLCLDVYARFLFNKVPWGMRKEREGGRHASTE